jgi:SAM-dependent MidA family methyltransferase
MSDGRRRSLPSGRTARAPRKDLAGNPRQSRCTAQAHRGRRTAAGAPGSAPRSIAAMRPSSLPEPDADLLAHSAQVQATIVAAIDAAGGWLPFDRLMELALYAPGLGYYAAGATKFGAAARGGDFVTAPELSPLFAQALARQVAPLLERSAPRLLEFGAGSGVLARDLLAGLRGLGVAIEDYAIVDLSPDLRERQRGLLGDQPVRWLESPPTEFEGVMLANEVLDAMPVTLFARRGGRVLERGVTQVRGTLYIEERPAGEALLAAVAALEAETGVLADGYASEIGLAARAWMASAAGWLRRGALLVIDYGFPRREFYHPQRRDGTLMCHFRHHAHGDPLWLPGANDITAHVDFSAVADAAHDAGLDVLGYTTQARFLLNCGLLELVPAGDVRAAAAAQTLLSEAEMGELFKVLLLAKGLGDNPPLPGFAHGDRLHTL